MRSATARRWTIERLLTVGAAAAALALLAGCAATPAPETPDEPAAVVVLQPFEEFGGGAEDPSVWCKVGFRYVYPPELAEHARKVTYDVVGSSMLSGGGALPLPRPERDPRPVLRDDGRMEMSVNISSFDPCRRPGSDSGPVVEFTIGECTEGDCPPMRFDPPDTELVEFRLVE